MRKLFYFILFFYIIIGNVKADVVYDTSLISISGFNNKVKLKILKPCVSVDFENNEKENNFEDGLQNKIDNIDNLLNSIDVVEEEAFVLEKNEEDKKEDKIVNNIKIYEEYSNVNNVDIFGNIYNKIINNLNITDLYFLDYDYDSCSAITSFVKENNSIDISEYIFSGKFADYDYVVSSEIVVNNENEIKLQIFMWDIVDEKFLDGRYYVIDVLKSDFDKIGNLVADFVFQKTTGESSGLFNSKIIYVSESGSIKNRKKQINIMNFDGSKNVQITRGNNLKLTPIFSKYDKNEVFFLEYTKDGPFILKHNLKNNKTFKISVKNQEMTSAATFNPSGKNQLIVASSKENAGTNLYLFDLNKKTNKQLTDNNGINTSASFSPDGSKMVYVSDKNGSRKLYVKDINTNEEKLISSGTGIYDKPSWSPDGRLIAFIKMIKGTFFVGIMTADGDAERLLMSSYLVEGIKWSPNSRYLIYTKQIGPFGKDSIPKIYIMDILTKHEYMLNTQDKEGASDPDWIMNF